MNKTVLMIMFCLVTIMHVVGGEVRALALVRSENMKPLELKDAAAFEAGFKISMDGKEAICDNGSNTSVRRGLRWGLMLNQKEPRPVTFTGCSRVEGSARLAQGYDGDYSIYADITYTDNTHSYGHHVTFPLEGALGWQKKELTIQPEKPIRHIAVYYLFRNRAGCVRFKEMAYYEHEVNGCVLFDEVKVNACKALTKPQFLIRDVGNNSGFMSLNEKESALGVTLAAAETKGAEGARVIEATLASAVKEDRLLTFVYIVPIAKSEGKGNATFFKSPVETLFLTPHSPEVKYVTTRNVGSNGKLSRYPFAAVEVDGKGYALGIHPDFPAYYRVVFNPKLNEIYIAFDVALTSEAPSAKFAFCVYTFVAKDGFRGALAKYYALFPDAHRVRVPRQGAWMPFYSISKVKDWQDFGFAFKEGDGEIPWDDGHDILTFRYTEPSTWWMKIPGNDQSYAAATQEVQRLVAAGNKQAKAWKTSAFQSASGVAPGRILDTPWCKGIVWNLNTAPGIAGEITDFKNKRGDLEKRYSKKYPLGCDGEYFDSAEGYVTDQMDFCRDHFAAMKTPLTFTRDAKKAGIYKGMIFFEYIRAIAKEVHSRGRYTMANCTPIAWTFLVPYLDVLGQETQWNHNGKWSPMSLEEMYYRRAICGKKPYCFLMNTDFTKWTYEMSEKFMKRSLAFGMFPGYFSADAATGHYFSQPKLYDRDRPLFKKYMPLCRKVAEAGWEPVQGIASVAPQGVVLERFGKDVTNCYLTVYNPNRMAQTVTITQLAPWSAKKSKELVTGETILWENGTATFSLDGEDVRVIECR